MDVKEAFKEYNPKLVRSLPLKDTHFIAELTKQNLFYGNLKDEVKAASTQSDAAARFLDEAIERPLNIGNREPFDKLLLIMEKFGSTLNTLAREIKQNITSKVCNYKLRISNIHIIRTYSYTYCTYICT